MIEYLDLPPDALSERKIKVSSPQGDPLFEIGFSREPLVTGDVYVTLTPLDGLVSVSTSLLKKMQTDLAEITSGYNLYCQTMIGDLKAARFAKFFGFTEVGKSHDRIHFRKDVA